MSVSEKEKRKKKKDKKAKKKKEDEQGGSTKREKCIEAWKGPILSILNTKWGATTFAVKKLPHEHNFKRQVIDAFLFGGDQ